MTDRYRQRWDLDSIFPGGSQSPALAAHLDELEQSLMTLRRMTDQLPDPGSPEGLTAWHDLLMLSQELLDRFYQAGAFLSCLNAQDVKDTAAKLGMGRLSQLGAAFGSVDLAWRDRIVKLPDTAWQKLLADPRFRDVAFPLQEMRDEARDLMDLPRESLANDLKVDGYNAWGRLYAAIVGRVKVEVDGEKLSAGQAYNRFSDPDPAVRAKVFQAWEEAWADQSELCAEALNHLAGFRLALNKHRGWDSVLKVPLEQNRMTRATLDAMWSAVEAGKPLLLEYMERKARLLGQEALHWYDENAPLGQVSRKVPYDEAADFVVEQFGKFSPRMADFARNAFEQGWIESEDRAGKQPGGFCTPMPLSQQCRIFLTYGGDAWGIGTIAHELGHAYHFHVMWDIPPMARQFAMNVAETASTFAEMITNRAAVAQAPTREEKLALLDSGIVRAVTMFMNIHARYLFESRFYEQRAKGALSVEQLNELMVQAQKDAFRGSLATYHPYFWASKGHFYGTGTEFYNFPYTFGLLFSAGVFARAEAEGPAFEQKYVDLLRDTGRMTVEELGRRHLGVDLTQPEFWHSAVDTVLEDVRTFLKLTE